jgi:hypothetical protein
MTNGLIEFPLLSNGFGRLDDAERSIRKLTSVNCGVDFDACEQVMMKATNELEIAVSAGTNYWDCFMVPIYAELRLLQWHGLPKPGVVLR